MRRLDYKQQLVDYFIKNINYKKYDADTLKIALRNQGYSIVAVNQAYDEAIKRMAKNAPTIEKPIIKHEIYNLEENPIDVEKMNFWEKLKHRLKGNKV